METRSKKRRVGDSILLDEMLDPAEATARFDVRRRDDTLYITDKAYGEAYTFSVQNLSVISMLDVIQGAAVKSYTWTPQEDQMQLRQLNDDEKQNVISFLTSPYFGDPPANQKIISLSHNAPEYGYLHADAYSKVAALNATLLANTSTGCHPVSLQLGPATNTAGDISYTLGLYHNNVCATNATLSVFCDDDSVVMNVENINTRLDYKGGVYLMLLVTSLLLCPFITSRTGVSPGAQVSVSVHNLKGNDARDMISSMRLKYSTTQSFITSQLMIEDVADLMAQATIQDKFNEMAASPMFRCTDTVPAAHATDYVKEKLTFQSSQLILKELPVQVDEESVQKSRAEHPLPEHVQDVVTVDEFNAAFTIYRVAKHKIIIYMKREEAWAKTVDYNKDVGGMLTLTIVTDGEKPKTYKTYTFFITSDVVMLEALPQLYNSVASLFWTHEDSPSYAQIQMTRGVLDSVPRYLPAAYEYVDVCNQVLSSRCTGLQLRLGPNFRMTGYVSQFWYKPDERPYDSFLLCLYAGDNCVSSITLSLDRQEIEIASRTTPAYENHSYNTLLRALAVSLSGDVSPVGSNKIVVSQIANKVSAWLLVKRLGADLMSRMKVGDWLTLQDVQTYGPCVENCFVYVKHPVERTDMTSKIMAASSLSEVASELSAMISAAYRNNDFLYAVIRNTPENIQRARDLVMATLHKLDCFNEASAMQKAKAEYASLSTTGAPLAFTPLPITRLNGGGARRIQLSGGYAHEWMGMLKLY